MKILLKNKKKIRWGTGDFVQSISCWLDGGGSECELPVNCKKGAGFKGTKC